MSEHHIGPKMKATQIKRLHAEAVAEGRATQEQADLVFWLYSYAMQNELSNQEIAEQVGYDQSNISRVLKMTYTGNWGNVCKRIKSFKQDAIVVNERAKYGDIGFVETSISRQIYQACHACREMQEISQIWGEPQTGKSAALKYYTQRNNSGRTRYIELESGMSHQGFLRYVAECCNAPVSGNVNVLRENIKSVLDENKLVIIDELHKPLIGSGQKTIIKIMDSIRDIFDKVGCGVMLCGTNTLRDEFTKGTLQRFLKQLNQRGIIKVQCPDTMPLHDAWKFSDAYGLPRPISSSQEHKMVQQIVLKHGVSIYTKFLKAGRKAAKGHPYTWADFIRAHDIIVKPNQPGWWNQK